MVNLNRLTEDAGKVFEPVPEDAQDQYQLWRGANLARIGLNLANGQRHISTVRDEDPESTITCFSSSHVWTRRYAHSLTEGTSLKLQFDPDHDNAALFDHGVEPIEHMPSIVIAMDPSQYDNEVVADIVRERPVSVIDFKIVGLERIDPHSRAFLEEYFEL